MSGFERPFVTTSAASSSSRAPQATASSHRASTGGIRQATPPPSVQATTPVRRESSLEGHARSSSSVSGSPASPDEEEWVADNSLLRADTPGIGYRRTQSISDMVDDDMLPWGESVRGRPAGEWGAWLQVGDRFLPMELNGVPVLQRRGAASSSLASPAAALDSGSGRPAAAAGTPWFWPGAAVAAVAAAAAAAAAAVPWRQSEAPSQWVSRRQQVAKPRLDLSSARYGQMFHRGAGRVEHVGQHYYKYVGESQGEFDTQELPRGGRGGFADFWWLLIPLCCCCGWVPLLALIRTGMGGGADLPTASSAPPAELGFDCDVGYSRARDEYTSVGLEARRWCCNHYDRGCRHGPAAAEASEEEAEGYDCSKGVDRWRDAWSPDKQSWCCQREGRGCPATTTSTTEYQYNCSDVAPGCLECMEAEWPKEKAEWCCLRRGLGCAVVEPQRVEFDCQAGYDRWRTGWSPDKREYCCNTTGHGCIEADVGAADVEPDRDHGAAGTNTSTTTTFVVGSRTCKPSAFWPQKVGDAYCGTCRHLVRMGGFTSCDDYCESFGQLCFRAAQDNSGKVGQGPCEVQTQVDCGDTFDLDELASDTSSLELVCGCENPGHAHTPAPTPSSLDCKSFLAWPNKEGGADCGTCKHIVRVGAFLTCDAYCASFGQRCFFSGVTDDTLGAEEPGCQAIEDVACSENVAEFQDSAGRSSGETMICGCQYPDAEAAAEGQEAAQYTWTTTTTTTMWFDCGAGPFPAEKRRWCCKNERIGCGEFECDSGPWPREKQEWCCRERRKGCDQNADGYFDCRQGPWPAKKRRWCCRNEGVMCEETD